MSDAEDTHLNILERLSAEQLTVSLSGSTGAFRCVCHVRCGSGRDCKEGSFLGGHEPDYFFKCTSMCCSQKPEDLYFRGGCIFTGRAFERHAGMERRKKWKDSIRCALTHQTIWEHLKTEARKDDTDLINRHVWVQWPLEEEGPTMFLGKITKVNPWEAECTIVYYYRRADERAEALCLPAEVHKLLPASFVPSEQQMQSIEAREANMQPVGAAGSRQYPRRHTQSRPQYKEHSDDDDFADDVDTTSRRSELDAGHDDAAWRNAAANGWRSGLAGSRRPAAVAGLDDYHHHRQLRPAPAHHTGMSLLQPAPQFRRSAPSGSALPSLGQNRSAAGAAHVASATAGTQTPAHAANAPSAASFAAAAASHARKLVDKAKQEEQEAQRQLAGWEEKLSSQDLPKGMQQILEPYLQDIRQVHVKAQVTIAVQEEWAAFWVEASEEGHFPENSVEHI